MNRYTYLIVAAEELHDTQLYLENGDVAGALKDIENIMESAPFIYVDDKELKAVVKYADSDTISPEQKLRGGYDLFKVIQNGLQAQQVPFWLRREP